MFKYLGRLLIYNDNDSPAMRSNLKKVRKSWTRVSCVLRAENASPKVSGVFYKATVQAVLLFGRETWKLSPAGLNSLEGFHIRAARHMAGMQPTQNLDRTWTYPSSNDVLTAVGLKTIDHYIEVRRETISKFILNQPIFALCLDGGRKRGLCVAHFGGSSLCHLTTRGQYLWGTKRTKEGTIFRWDNNLYG